MDDTLWAGIVGLAGFSVRRAWLGAFPWVRLAIHGRFFHGESFLACVVCVLCVVRFVCFVFLRNRVLFSSFCTRSLFSLRFLIPWYVLVVLRKSSHTRCVCVGTAVLRPRSARPLRSRARFPTASNPRPNNGMEIVSLALTGLPRPHPFAMERGADAMEVCVCVWSWCAHGVVHLFSALLLATDHNTTRFVLSVNRLCHFSLFS